MKRDIERAEILGFCMGVRRAVAMVYEALHSDTPKPVYTFGPIIHNNSVIKDLREKGVVSIDSPEDASGTVIIRAHGISPDLRKELQEKGIELLDATCPRVLHSQEKVKEFCGRGYRILIAGDRDHGEVRGLAGYCGNCRIIGTQEEAETVQIPPKSMIIAQTTFSPELFQEIVDILRKRLPDLAVVNSICPATEKRQEALKQLCRRNDAILVIGGKNSANTRRLFETARKLCPASWHIENAEEIPNEVYHFTRIGLSAGASTPDWVIDEVEKKLRNID